MSEGAAAVDYSNSSRGKFVPFSNDQLYPDVKQLIPSDAAAAAAASATRSSAASPGPQSHGGHSESISQSSRLPMLTPSPPPGATATSQSEVVVLHEDSGVRIPTGAAARPGVTVVEMPPTYSAT